MNWIAFGTVAAALWSAYLIGMGLYLFCFGRNARKTLAALEKAAGAPQTPRSKMNAAAFLVLSVVASLFAQKPDNPLRLLVGGRSRPAETVSAQDIARGYRLESESVCDGHSCAMPSNATLVGSWHVHGASSPFGRNRIDFGDWAFPLGSNDSAFSSLWFTTDAALRAAPHDTLREVRALPPVPTLAMQGVSRLWMLAEDDETRTVGWECVFPSCDTNAPVSAAISMRRNGDFTTWSNNVARVYRRISPDDWDEDGLANEIDPRPTVYDGECFGTSEAWYNANCSAVLSAAADTNGETAITWNAGVCAEAYYWLEFVSSASGNRISAVCDGPSSLGDMAIIAASNQTCRIPLLIGARYHVTADFNLENISASDEAAVITYNRRGCNDMTVERPVDIGVGGEYPDYALYIWPYVGAEFSSVSGGCCNIEFSLSNLTWQCAAGCNCSGFGHQIDCAATWEGYTGHFAWSGACDCQERNKRDPQTWFSLTAPGVLVKHGYPHFVSGQFHPPVETNHTLTLSCVGGADRISVLNNGDGWLEVMGVQKSASAGDVLFELRLDVDGSTYCKTQALTVVSVKQLHMTSPVGGESANPPPFPGESQNPFSVTNSPAPDRHLAIPFHCVADNDLNVSDFAVNLRLELEPDVSASSGLNAEWSIVEDSVQSGSLIVQPGLVAQFVNPKRGGVIRFSASCDGSPETTGTLVLPLAGAAVDAVFTSDFFAAGIAAQNMENSWCRYLITPFWGWSQFYWKARGDYVGRVDSAARPTVWTYNQINDESHLGAVATLDGVPVRMSKLSNFLVSYAATGLGVNGTFRSIATYSGTGDDASAKLSWDTGEYVATNGSFIAASATMATNMWRSADAKVRRLWPNSAPTDNHLPCSQISDYERSFCSPGFIEEWSSSDD